MYYSIFNTPISEVIAVGDEQGLQMLHLNTNQTNSKFTLSKRWQLNNNYFTEVKQQVLQYLAGNRKHFTLKLNPQGTEFQKQVWQELLKIPYGQTISYKQLAINIGNAKASRAVGAANGKNPLAIIIPCHRVIGSNGQLTGYAHGLTIKQKLLNTEKLNEVYDVLLQHYGPLNWWPAKNSYEVMVGAILTQNTSWSNVEKAISNFKQELTAQLIKQLSINDLAQIIKPSGYYNQKAKKLKALTDWFEQYDFNILNTKHKTTLQLRTELLNIFGVGKETADCILTYALKKPSFIIDTYTKRLLTRLGFKLPNEYNEIQNLFQQSIAPDLYKYNEYHALIVKHATEFCFKTPKCTNCPLLSLCQREHVS